MKILLGILEVLKGFFARKTKMGFALFGKVDQSTTYNITVSDKEIAKEIAETMLKHLHATNIESSQVSAREHVPAIEDLAGTPAKDSTKNDE